MVTMAMNIPDALTLGSFYFYNEKRKAMLIDLIKLVSDTPFTYHTGNTKKAPIQSYGRNFFQPHGVPADYQQ